MDEESIRQDRELARTAIRRLISYAERSHGREKMMRDSRSGVWLKMFLQESGFLTGKQEDVYIQGVLGTNFSYFVEKRKKMC